MKSATSFLVVLCLVASLGISAHESEPASDCDTAAEALASGIEADPDQLLLLFEDSLQTNPGFRRELLLTAIRSSDPDAELLSQIIYIARNQFPEDTSLLAETALSEKPEFSDAIRDAFMADDSAMQNALAHASEKMESAPNKTWLAEARKMDDDIREAMARMNARISGKPWPGLDLPYQHFGFEKSDAIRTSHAASGVDESSLANSNAIDRIDEQAVAAHEVKMNDRWKPSKTIHLDESRFAIKDPLEANQKSIATAGKAGMPPLPTLPRSSVYYIPQADDRYVSTVDFEKDGKQRPSLVIRSVPASPTTPK